MFRVKAFSAAILSAGTGLACLALLAQLDFQAVLLIRSLHSPFVERLGNIGNRLGDEITLLALCAGLWGVGWIRRSRTWRQAGLDALVGHALAGIAAQILKHLIGRPRPRFAHQDAFEHGPSLQGGLDAFPSGHTAVSFAVVAVLARYFPAWIWAWYGGAVFVGLSRFFRGSHFPTDVLGGAVLGFLIGYVWARPLGEWRRHAVRALPLTLPFVVGGCAIVWSAFSAPVQSGAAAAMFWTGLLLCAGGMGARWFLVWQGHGSAGFRTSPSARQAVPRPVYANLVIVLGLAVSLQTWWIVAATLTACVAWWIMAQLDPHPPDAPLVSREVRLTGLWALLLAVVQSLHGVAPLR